MIGVLGHDLHFKAILGQGQLGLMRCNEMIGVLGHDLHFKAILGWGKLGLMR